MYSIQDISAIIKGRFQQEAGNGTIAHLIYDSRKIQEAETSLFFALQTAQNDGHRFLPQAYKSGIRHFVVAHPVDASGLPGSNIIVVADTLRALQQLATFHRQQFNLQVIGITGSNGKTIVKEWLNQLLSSEYHIVRSPKSFNSQIGVPLSVWQVNEQHTLGIFEAGISQPGEMETLAQIIQPVIGVLTNIGEAHDEGFESKGQKLAEKLKLFKNAEVVIARAELVQNFTFKRQFSWSYTAGATVVVEKVIIEQEGATITCVYQQQPISIRLPFTDEASIENAITCCCVLLYLGIASSLIEQRFLQLHKVDMRLHLMHGINHCTLINDSYSADLTSLHIALGFLQQQHFNQPRTVILSDFYESGKSGEVLYRQISESIKQYGIQKAVLIGKQITTYLPPLLNGQVAEVMVYNSTADFIQHFRTSTFSNEVVLIKGARLFGFEQIVQLLEYKVHQTLLEINLNAVVHNLKQYAALLQPSTKIMAMVKAFAYGSGGAEIASVLQYHNVNYLGVAYTDEGVDLRKAGITLPIMVMNADDSSFAAVTEYNLQPVIYSKELLQEFEAYIDTQGLQAYPVHIEVETGMNRLGFPATEIEALGSHLAASPFIKVESVFSHLAASEDEAQDEFTAQQAQLFSTAVTTLSQHLSYPFIQHLANSAAIIRHPHLQLGMVRLGIGLYGIEIATDRLELQTAATLRTTIAQIKYLKKGETVSYNRRGVVKEDAVIATVRLGYADGYSRRFSNGVGKLLVKGQLAPVIGTVCMDMTMIDVTGINGVKEGDEVIVFGAQLPVQEVAGWVDTIPYELMTSISQRVKRIYFQE